MADPKPLIAFYGATGGSTLAAIVPALKAGFDCTALARTPAKLTNLLLERGVPQSAIDTHLTISQGDVLSVDSVKSPLTLHGRPADIIVSGIGIVNFSEAMRESTLCGDAANNILSALQALELAKKPHLIILSTTGITTGQRDVPIAFLPMYHWMLKHPHDDKRRMERAVVEHSSSANSRISGYTIVRPSLLTNGKALGESKIRVGSEEEPAVGYTISRDDVGLWMFENLLQSNGGSFVGKKPTITY